MGNLMHSPDMTKTVLSILLGACCASAWWATATFGLMPPVIMAAIITSGVIGVVIASSSLDIFE